MSEFIEMVSNLIINELNKKEVEEKILHPLLIWMLWQIIPFVLLFICLNFFLTIAAICLVLYFRK
jgi:hypothetical protein